MKVLVDSNALFGIFVKTDALHSAANKILTQLLDAKADLYVLNIVIQETATLLSYKWSQAASLLFLEKLSDIKLITINLDSTLEEQAWRIFKLQTKKGISFVDCANLAAIKYYKLDRIFSFDTFYPKNIRI